MPTIIMNSNFFVNNQEEFSNHPIVQSSIYHGQYDNQDSCWDPNKKGINSLVRCFIYKFLLPYTQLSQSRNIFEIGCGTGWLLAEIKKYEPNIIIGIDPSIKNINIAKHLYPDIQINCSSFENFKTNDKYNSIYSVMTLSHFLDLESFFIRCANIMEVNGELIIVVPNFDYFQRPRFGYMSELVHFDSQCAIRIKNKSGSLSQIVRKNEVYHKAANQAGLSLLTEKLMKIDEDLVTEEPKYKKNFGLAMHNLIVYKK